MGNELRKTGVHNVFEDLKVTEIHGDALLAITRLQAEKAVLKEELDKWQKMCQEFVGCSMLADEFADEPHEPESFGRYIKNLSDQIDALTLKAQALVEALEACAENDKTEYDYNGKVALNRFGKKPGVGKRFQTPQEIAQAALLSWRKGS